MKKPIRVLIVEDSEDDAALLIRALQRGGYDPVYEVVETPEAMADALDRQEWDLVISDYSMPRFSGLDARKLLQEKDPDLSFILMTGQVGEDAAVEAMEAGARDYILKSNPARLIPAIERELCDARELKRERDFSGAILDTVGALVVVMDRDGRIVRFNRTCEKVSGYSLEEVLGKNFMDLLIIPEERAMIELRFQTLFEHKHSHNGENFWLTKTGDRRLITWKNAVLLDQASSVEYAIATGLDITEQRQAERILRQSEERFRILFESAPVGIVIARGGRILLANQAFLYMFGLGGDSGFSDKPLAEYIAPDYRREILERLSNLEQGIAVPSLLETFGLKKDGPVFSIFVEIARLDLPDGPAAVAFISDITDRKLAEERLRESYAKLEQTLEQTVKSLSSIAEMRDPYTAGHQVRVANLACAIASELGMSEEQIHAIRTAALIHDIGKMIVPSEILNKPGELNALEKSFVKTHAQASYEIVRTIEFTRPIAEIVLQHHEKLNGSGYPRGLSGDSILKEARVLTIADVIETMVSHRPYRPAFSSEQALDEIRQQRGVLYDHDAVDACLRLFLEKGFSLAVGTDQEGITGA